MYIEESGRVSLHTIGVSCAQYTLCKASVVSSFFGLEPGQDSISRESGRSTSIFLESMNKFMGEDRSYH